MSKAILALPKKHAPILRLNSICPYYTMFPLTYPFRVLSEARRSHVLLDPFCGRGTSLYAARLKGMKAYGIDSNPVAAAVATSKLLLTSSKSVYDLCQAILQDCQMPENIPTGLFWEICYHKDTLVELCKLRNYLMNNCTTDDEKMLRAIILGILHGPKAKVNHTYLSNQMPRTYATKPAPAVKYWLNHEMQPDKFSVLNLVKKRAEFTLSELPAVAGGNVFCADSRQENAYKNLPPVDWIVTSPPYFGMRTYVPDQWLRNWFMGGPAYVEYAHKDQLSHHKVDFLKDLSTIWKNCASACAPRAKMRIRFGSLPSEMSDARQVLIDSITEANCGWSISAIRSAGVATNGHRQADHFNSKTGEAAAEIDLYACLL